MVARIAGRMSGRPKPKDTPMRKIIVLGTLAAALGLAVVAAQARDTSGSTDTIKSPAASEMPNDPAGGDHERDAWKYRSNDDNARSPHSKESRERHERSARSGETREQHDAREDHKEGHGAHDESRERHSRRR
jgi:hypothetical protein